MSTVTIDERFHGPPRSANGGYVCGLLAAQATSPVVVSLRVPPPLGRPLELQVEDEVTVQLRDGDTVLGATDAFTGRHPDPPAIVDPRTAAAASERFVGFADHAFPTCWTCGPERAGDGLQIFPGPVEGHDTLVAAPWTPTGEVDAGDGTVRTEHVWAALDCPSYFGAVEDEPALLASLAADLRAPVRVGEPHVVLGWRARPIDGRKRHGGSAVLDPEGTVLAVATSLWVTLSDEALRALLEGA